MCQKVLNKNLFIEIFLYRLFSIQGRSSRKEFIIKFCTMLMLFWITGYTMDYTKSSNSWVVLILDSLIVIAMIVYTVQMFPLIHRRLHDLNASGWWQLITFIPFGQILIIGFIFFKGTDGPNKYGPPPTY